MMVKETDQVLRCRGLRVAKEDVKVFKERCESVQRGVMLSVP